MNTRVLWAVIFILLAVIIALAAILILAPAPVKTPIVPAVPVATSTPQAPTPSPSESAPSPAPLSASVSVSSPISGATVGHSLSVTGKVPGNWSSEAQFPLMVRDANGNVVGRATGHLQGDWQTTALVPFTATIQIDGNFRGLARLVLLKDNPSGLPENDDSMEVPIVIQ